MSSVVANRRISVGDAIRTGLFHLQWLPILIIAFGFGAAAYFKLMLHDEAGPAVVWSIFTGFFIASVYYSFASTLWRLWAFPKVENPIRLEAKALAFKMIWPKGHFMNRLEFRLFGFGRRIREMEAKVREKLDRTGPVHIRQFGDYYELRVLPENLQRDTALAILGFIFLFLNFFVGLLITVFFGSMAMWAYINRNDLQRYLRFDILGITHGKRFIPWQNIRDWIVEPIGFTAASFKLTLLLHEGTVFIELVTLAEAPLDLEVELEGYYQLHTAFNNYGPPVPRTAH